MIMKKIVLAALVLFSIVGCQSDDNDPNVPGNNTPVVIGFTDIIKGTLPGNSVTQGNFVIKDKTGWDNFKEDAGVDPNVPVDFSIHEVIAVVDETYPGQGHAIEITSVTQLDNKLTVQIKKTTSDGPITAVETQPLHVVRIKKTGLPVVFKADAPL
jgi:hypothetical protein